MLDSTGGALVYERTGPDGPSWAAMAETTRLAADWEEAFLAGCRETFPGHDAAQVQVLRYAEVSLICTMDPQSKPVSLSIDVPAEQGSGSEYHSGERVSAAQLFETTLEPADSRVLVLGRP